MLVPGSLGLADDPLIQKIPCALTQGEGGHKFLNAIAYPLFLRGRSGQVLGLPGAFPMRVAKTPAW